MGYFVVGSRSDGEMDLESFIVLKSFHNMRMQVKVNKFGVF